MTAPAAVPGAVHPALKRPGAPFRVFPSSLAVEIRPRIYATPFMTSAPCYREVGPLKLKLSLPPAGLIDRTHLHVFREPTRNSKNPVEKAYIRADRVQDFVRGQGLAEGTEYVVSRKKRGSALSSTEFDIAVGSTVRSTPPRAAGSVGRAGARGRERHGLTC